MCVCVKLVDLHNHCSARQTARRVRAALRLLSCLTGCVRENKLVNHCSEPAPACQTLRSAVTCFSPFAALPSERFSFLSFGQIAVGYQLKNQNKVSTKLVAIRKCEFTESRKLAISANYGRNPDHNYRPGQCSKLETFRLKSRQSISPPV